MEEVSRSISLRFELENANPFNLLGLCFMFGLRAVLDFVEFVDSLCYQRGPAEFRSGLVVLHLVPKQWGIQVDG